MINDRIRGVDSITPPYSKPEEIVHVALGVRRGVRISCDFDRVWVIALKDQAKVLGDRMDKLFDYVAGVAGYFKTVLADSVIEVYRLGSLAHGGFSKMYSDIDVGLLLNCTEPPVAIPGLIAEAKALDAEYGKKLSIFWGNPDFNWGRLPVIDRLDLLDHGVPILYGITPDFCRPTRDEIHQEQLQSIERSWKLRLPELSRLTALEAKDRKPYIRAILYPARLIYTWDKLAVDSNDRAVEYLHQVQPPGLDLKPIDMALACRNEKCTAEDVFALRADLDQQCESAVSYISVNGH
jgi:predicted nucleotidyltransferase